MQCAHCDRQAALWCPGCVLAFCPPCWSMVPHHEFLGTPDLWGAGTRRSRDRERDRDGGSESDSVISRSRTASSTPLMRPSFDVMLGPKGELISNDGSVGTLSDKERGDRSGSRMTSNGSRGGLALGANFVSVHSQKQPTLSLPDLSRGMKLQQTGRRSSRRKSSTLSYEMPMTAAQRAQQVDMMRAMAEARLEYEYALKGKKGKISKQRSQLVSLQKLSPPVQMVQSTKGSAGVEVGVEPSHKTSRISDPMAGITTEYVPEEWRVSMEQGKGVKPRPIAIFKGVSVYTADETPPAGKQMRLSVDLHHIDDVDNTEKVSRSLDF